MVSLKDIRLISRETYEHPAVCHQSIIYLQCSLKNKEENKKLKNIKFTTETNQPNKF